MNSTDFFKTFNSLGEFVLEIERGPLTCESLSPMHVVKRYGNLALIGQDGESVSEFRPTRRIIEEEEWYRPCFDSCGDIIHHNEMMTIIGEIKDMSRVSIDGKEIEVKVGHHGDHMTIEVEHPRIDRVYFTAGTLHDIALYLEGIVDGLNLGLGKDSDEDDDDRKQDSEDCRKDDDEAGSDEQVISDLLKEIDSAISKMISEIGDGGRKR